MQATKETLTPTRIKLTIVADEPFIQRIRATILEQLAKDLKVPGFRAGKVPMNVAEKHVSQSQLQTDFLQAAVNEMYVSTVEQEKLRPVSQPEISVTKFVPFSALEVTVETDVVSEVKLPDYRKIKVTRTESKVAEKQIDQVIDNLLARSAERNEVKRAAAKGDELVIDFKGVDAKTKEAITGADGNGYPLTIGSNTFIPGFEDELIGLKPGAKKDFDITFPENYGVKSLQKRKVKFSVTVQKIQELKLPKLDDKFAASVGPFKTVVDLKKDIRRELEAQAKQEADRKFESDLLEAIANKTKVEIPAALIDQELDTVEQQERQDLIYRGQTWQEHLDAEGVTEEEHRAKNRPGAELRVKAGLILGEIADKEKIQVTPDELEIRMQVLKGRYAQDEQMMAELDKPENRRDILSRLLTEKTLDLLKSFQAN